MKKLVVVTAVFLALAGCAAKTPEEAFISAVHTSNPDSVGVPNDILLWSGHTICKDYAEHGSAGVIDNLNSVYATNGKDQGDTLSFIVAAATSQLCPKKGT